MQRKNMIERKQNPEQKGRTILRNILITVGIMGAATIVWRCSIFQRRIRMCRCCSCLRS